jgi:trimeric autotransporter adhesin
MRHALLLLATLLLAACPTVEEVVTLDRLEVEPVTGSLAAGRVLQLRAMGVWSNGGRMDLTEEADWFASDPDRASVSDAAGSRGLVLALAEGYSAVTATVDMMAASSEITVLPPELELLVATPLAVDLPVGAGRQLEATGWYSDGSYTDLTELVTWTSDDAAVALPADGSELPTGFVVATGPGSCVVSGALDDAVADVEITVWDAELETIVLDPEEPEPALGSSIQFTATGTWSDGTQTDLTSTATWSSSDPDHLDFSDEPGQEGRALATGEGGAIVEVEQAGLIASTVVTVVEAELEWLQTDPLQLQLSLGNSWPMGVTGGFSDGSEVELVELVTWSSDDPSVVTTSNDLGDQGTIRAVGVGGTTVRARLGELEAFAAIDVGEALLIGLFLDPQLPSVPLGVDAPFTLVGLYSDGAEVDHTEDAAWGVDLLSVALPSPLTGEAGVILTVGEGSATVTAGLPPLAASTVLTVTPPELVSILVTPAGAQAAVGEVLQFEATGSYTDGALTDLTTDVFWATSTPGFAVADNLPGHEGEVSALAEGTVTVLANLPPVSGNTILTVGPPALVSLTIDPPDPTVVVGATLQLTALGLYTDGQEVDLTEEVVWSSMAPGTATASNDAGVVGTVSGVAAGIATVVASSGETTTSAQVEVVAP